MGVHRMWLWVPMETQGWPVQQEPKHCPPGMMQTFLGSVLCYKKCSAGLNQRGPTVREALGPGCGWTAAPLKVTRAVVERKPTWVGLGTLLRS